MKNKGKVRQLYSERADMYERVFVNRMGWGKVLESFFHQSPLLRPGMRILDAGCGTGVVTRTLYKVMQDTGLDGTQFHAFDLTQSMLDIFQQEVDAQGMESVELAQGDVLKPDSLPAAWGEYDLIVSSALLEHIPRGEIPHAVGNLTALLKEGGVLLLIVTRKTWVTMLTGRLWWKTNLFEEAPVKEMLELAGYRRIEFRQLPPGWAKHMIVVEAAK